MTRTVFADDAQSQQDLTAMRRGFKQQVAPRFGTVVLRH